MGNNLLPARLGEILRAHCTTVKTSTTKGGHCHRPGIHRRPGKFLDGLVLAVFGLVGIALVPWLDRRLQWTLCLVSLAFAGLTLGARP